MKVKKKQAGLNSFLLSQPWLSLMHQRPFRDNMQEGLSPQHREGVSGHTAAKANQLREGNLLFLPGRTVRVQEQLALPSSGYERRANGHDQLWSLPPLTEAVLLVCDQSSLVLALLERKLVPPVPAATAPCGRKGFWSNTSS